jgi:hypothetical protein
MSAAWSFDLEGHIWDFCVTCWEAKSGWRHWVGLLMGLTLLIAGMFALGIVLDGLGGVFDLGAKYVSTHPLAAVILIYLAVFALSLGALYLIVRVIRAAWKGH